MPPVALQLYTVREDCQRDFAGTLRQVAAMGYAGVELAGYGGFTAAALRSLLDDLGLAVAGNHVRLERLENELDQVIEENLVLGNRYVVCPSIPEYRRQDEAGWRQVAGSLDAIGQRLKAHGLQLCYHNHAFEFVRVGEGYALDLLFAATDPDRVKAELDVYWVRRGGEDPVAYLRRLGPRCPLVHLKDMAPDGSFAEVGTGQLDFAAICAAASGAAWFVVEQDVCQRPPLESARISLENLHRMGLA